MTPREIEVMRAKNLILFLWLSLVFGLLIANGPASGADTASLIIMPIIVSIVQYIIVFTLYHAKADFGLPRMVIWAAFLSPLTMCPALWMWPADNEPAAVCFMIANAVVGLTIVRKAPVEDSKPATVLDNGEAPEAESTASVNEDNGDLSEALGQVQQIIQMQGATPDEKMRELHHISSLYAERVGDLPVVS